MIEKITLQGHAEKPWVRSKDLYAALGIEKLSWYEWVKTYILNPITQEGVDFEVIISESENSTDRKSIELAVSIPFAESLWKQTNPETIELFTLNQQQDANH